MKVKKFCRLIDGYEMIRIWGKSDNVPLYYGEASAMPSTIGNLKINKHGADNAFAIEYRYNCADICPHYAIQVKEQ